MTYECDGCGACCRVFPVYASAADGLCQPRIREEARQLQPWLQTPERAYRLFPLPFHETCCFLDAENRCTIYDTRPSICREFAPGSDQCQEARANAELPGLFPTLHQLNVGPDDGGPYGVASGDPLEVDRHVAVVHRSRLR